VLLLAAVFGWWRLRLSENAAELGERLGSHGERTGQSGNELPHFLLSCEKEHGEPGHGNTERRAQITPVEPAGLVGLDSITDFRRIKHL